MSLHPEVVRVALLLDGRGPIAPIDKARATTMWPRPVLVDDNGADMASKMVRCRHRFQVLGPVVSLVAVDVMHMVRRVGQDAVLPSH